MLVLDNSTKAIINFIEHIGISVALHEFDTSKEFVPGIAIEKGGLVIDLNRLKYPGDILHEAAHLAVSTAEDRKLLDGVLDNKNPNAPAEDNDGHRLDLCSLLAHQH